MLVIGLGKQSQNIGSYEYSSLVAKLSVTVTRETDQPQLEERILDRHKDGVYPIVLLLLTIMPIFVTILLP